MVYKGFSKEIVNLEKNLSPDSFLLGEFSHADINLMSCFHRLEEMKLGQILQMPELPKVSDYWQKLKSRESYQKGILNYYTNKEHNVIKDFYKDSPSPYLDLILDELAKRN